MKMLFCTYLDYILLCGIWSNPKWSFGWPSAYLYEWADGVQDWFSFCLWVAWGLALELSLFLFCSGSSLWLWLECRTYAIDLYLVENCCSLMNEIWDFYWWCILRHGCRDFIMLLRYFVWWFSAASFWKHSYACFELIEDVTSKPFWIIELLHDLLR